MAADLDPFPTAAGQPLDSRGAAWDAVVMIVETFEIVESYLVLEGVDDRLRRLVLLRVQDARRRVEGLWPKGGSL